MNGMIFSKMIETFIISGATFQQSEMFQATTTLSVCPLMSLRFDIKPIENPSTFLPLWNFLFTKLIRRFQKFYQTPQ